MQQITPQDRETRSKDIYDVGLDELKRVSVEDTARKQVESDFMEARGRETARLHVTLRALDETERRTIQGINRLAAEVEERAEKLQHLIETFESTSGKQLTEVQGALAGRVTELQRSISQQVQEARSAIASTHRAHFESLETEVSSFRSAIADDVQQARRSLTDQGNEQYNALAEQGRQSTERLSNDISDARDEIVRLVDARMNQSDASFAAVRGDVEVLKHLVMDIIKARVGRTDPDQRPR